MFLAKGPRYAAGDVALGSVTVTEGASNYDVPAAVDPRGYAYT